MNTSKAYSLILIIICILVSACKKDNPGNTTEDKNDLNWETMSPFPGYVRKNAAGFWIGDNFYTGFGLGYLDDTFSHMANLNDFYEYNSLTKIWTKKADFPGSGRYSVASFSIGNKGYIGFGMSLDGSNQTVYKDIWEYDPATDTWSNEGTYNQIENGETIYSNSFEIKGKAYITLGYNLWVFDPSDKSLAKIGPVAEYMNLTTGFEINDKLYIGTGGTPNYSMTFYEFDPETSLWTKKADFPGQLRRFASGFALKGKGYILCGEGTKQIAPNSFKFVGLKDVWQYDPVSNVWTKFKDYPGLAYIGQVGSNSDTKGCVGTGEAGSPTVYYSREFWLVR